MYPDIRIFDIYINLFAATYQKCHVVLTIKYVGVIKDVVNFLILGIGRWKDKNQFAYNHFIRIICALTLFIPLYTLNLCSCETKLLLTTMTNQRIQKCFSRNFALVFLSTTLCGYYHTLHNI